MPEAPKQTGTTPDFPTVLVAAKREMHRLLPEIASELLAWRDTGILPDGKLREIAASLRPFLPHNHLSVAEKLATDAALEAVSAQRI